jgi:nucleoside-diphosphate-sugar epimerase
VVRGILLALQHGRNSEAYALGGEDATVPQFLDMVTRVSGVRRAVAAVPAQAVLPVAVAGRLACRLGLRASLTPAWLNHFLEDRPVGIAAARADLGYAPLGLEDGLRLTIGWLQQQRKGPWHVPVLQHG